MKTVKYLSEWNNGNYKGKIDWYKARKNVGCKTKEPDASKFYQTFMKGVIKVFNKVFHKIPVKRTLSDLFL